MIEEWRAIPGFGGRYEASTAGRIRSVVVDQCRGVVLRPNHSTKGYLQVYLSPARGAKRCARPVHRLVLLAFAGQCPERCQALHRDGDKANNHTTNLIWGTARDNAADREKHGRTARGAGHPNARLTDSDLQSIRNDRRTLVVVAREYGVHFSTISRVRRGETYATQRGH